MILSKQILKVGLITLLTLNMVQARGYKSHNKKHRDEIKIHECIKAKFVKGIGMGIVEGGCTIIGGLYGAVICGGIISATEDKVGQSIARRLCD